LDLRRVALAQRGFHPLLAYLDGSEQALPRLLRRICGISSGVVQVRARRWPLRGHLPWLQDELEQENHAADDETGEDRKPEHTSAQPGIPGRQSGPEGERDGFQQDDDADRVSEREIREMENQQDSQRWDGEQEEPQLEARRDEPLLDRRPSSEL
jgi:hypothetical protein